jgi:hypothetical protein
MLSQHARLYVMTWQAVVDVAALPMSSPTKQATRHTTHVALRSWIKLDGLLTDQCKLLSLTRSRAAIALCLPWSEAWLAELRSASSVTAPALVAAVSISGSSALSAEPAQTSSHGCPAVWQIMR